MRSEDDDKKRRRGGGWIVGVLLVGGAAALATLRARESAREGDGDGADQEDLLAHWDAQVEGILRALRAEHPCASEEEIERLAMAPAGPIERLTKQLQQRR